MKNNHFFVQLWFWCRSFKYVKTLWYAATAAEDESVWKAILDDDERGFVEIGRLCTAVFAQILFSACEAYYSSWEDMDEEFMMPQASSGM